MIKRWFTLFYILAMVSLLAGACGGSTTSGISVWIDVPVDGLHFSSLQEIQIEGHATSPGGISRIEVWVNGAVFTTINDPPTEGTLAKFQTAWTPTALGEHTIQVIAFGADGAASAPDSTRVTFGDVATATPLGCPSPVGGGPTPVYCGPVGCPSPIGGGPTPGICDCATPAGGGPTPVNCGPVVSGCPSPVGGGPTPGICPTDTATSPPPPGKVVQFLADPPTIEAGACTTVRWHVENVQKVIFGGVEQPFDGSYEDCLCKSERYTLTVVNQDGTEEKHRVEIAVNGSCVMPEPEQEEPAAPPENPPPAQQDSTPPSVPVPDSPSNGAKLDCKGSQSLSWSVVNDPSGIARYEVQVQKHSGDEKWQGAGTLSANGNATSVSVECGWYYRWRVRAVDGAGNVGGWSGWSTFSITLN
ncbi:MAG: Ig-like domain-containing protein [Chloroflexota bacterium]